MGECRFNERFYELSSVETHPEDYKMAATVAKNTDRCLIIQVHRVT